MPDEPTRSDGATRDGASPDGATPDGAIRPSTGRGAMLSRISTGLVQLHSRYYGKGPTKAKSHMVNGTVICILRDGFTTVERTLLDTGERESVHQMRRSFQQVMEWEFRRLVEDATGRKTIAYMSAVHTNPDLAVEIFVLEPLDGAEEVEVPTAPGDGA
ncbi:MAG: Na-translocating system protein MpsC family protein [Solirubrobacterales bacterium]